MGYETRLMIGQKSAMGDKIKFYFLQIASIDLSKVCYGEMEKLINQVHNPKNSRKYPRTFYYGGSCQKCGSEPPIFSDSYGSKLRLVPIQEVLDAMIADNKGEPYRRFDMTIPFLQEAIKGFGENTLFCILFGY